MSKAPGRPSTTLSEARILEVAESEFSKLGFEATRLEDIAAELGVTRPTLIHRFGSKDALYAAVVSRVCARVRDALLSAMSTTGAFPARLSATVARFHEHLSGDSTAARLLLRELVDARGPGLKLLRDEVGPLLGLVEAFVLQSGKGHLRRGLDVRSALLDLVGAMTLHTVAGGARAALYGPKANDRTYSREHFVQLASRTFLEEAAPKKTSRKRS